MKFTSAQASKLLKKLEEELESVLMLENRSKTFLAAVGEDVESVRPAYDYSDIQEKIRSIEEKIRKVKHAINLFNTAHVVEGTGMTIDQLLIYIPQLSRRKQKLAQMKNILPKSRVDNRFGNSSIIDYCYANYDIERAEADHSEVSDTLSRMQTALDTANNTVSFEIDIEP